MRAQRSRILRLTGRNIASKSPVLASGATEPAILSTGISCTPPKARPSNPAARSTGSIDRSRPARPVRTEPTLRQNARARAESKSSMARKRSRPKRGGAWRGFELEKGLFAFAVEEVHPSCVEAEADTVTRRHSHAGIHARGELVAADRAVKVLVGAKALHHVDLHVENRPAVRGAVRDRFGTESKSALGTSR